MLETSAEESTIIIYNAQQRATRKEVSTFSQQLVDSEFYTSSLLLFYYIFITFLSFLPGISFGEKSFLALLSGRVQRAEDS